MIMVNYNVADAYAPFRHSAWNGWTPTELGYPSFLLVVFNGSPLFHLATLRIYGVLQRIAIFYLIAGLFYLWRSDAWSKVVAIVVLLVGYFVLMRYVPVPGFG